MSELPDPNVLLEEALAEDDKHYLRPYRTTIRALREKKFSYRQIADWLNDRGLDVDHNSIYREHTKHMSPEEESAQDLYDQNLEEIAED